MKQRRKNAFFQDLLEAGSRTTYHRKRKPTSREKMRAREAERESIRREREQIRAANKQKRAMLAEERREEARRRKEEAREAPHKAFPSSAAIEAAYKRGARSLGEAMDMARGNPSIFDYEDAARAGRVRGAQLGTPVAKNEIRNEFNIWWKYGGKNFADPKDRAGNFKGNPRGSKGKFQRCVESVAARGGAYDPRAVCGAMEKRMRGNPVSKIYVSPSGRFKGHWEVGVPGYPVQTKKSKRGALSLAKRIQAQEGGEIIEREVPAEVRPAPAWMRNPAAGAIAVSEEFHGRKVKQMVPVQTQRHYHKYLADLGELRKLVVLTRDGKGKVTLTGFKGAMLTCNEAKDQLFITGGDQTVNPKDFGIDHPHEVETLGEVVTIEYFTDKHHLGSEGGTATYTHKFRSTNENGKHVTVRTARNPDLIYHKRDKHLEFSGGSYLIRKEGIDL